MNIQRFQINRLVTILIAALLVLGAGIYFAPALASELLPQAAGNTPASATSSAAL